MWSLAFLILALASESPSSTRRAPWQSFWSSACHWFLVLLPFAPEIPTSEKMFRGSTPESRSCRRVRIPGPSRKVCYRGSVYQGEPGCWWYRLGEKEDSRGDLPIDLVSQLYAGDHKEGRWLLPLHNPFVADLSVFANGFAREED